MSSNTVTDLISHNYGVVFDNQTVRLKLKEYETLGILVSHKAGKTLSYALAPLMPMETEPQCVNSGDMEPDGTCLLYTSDALYCFEISDSSAVCTVNFDFDRNSLNFSGHNNLFISALPCDRRVSPCSRDAEVFE